MLISDEFLTTEDPQIRYDCYFMSIVEFRRIYGEVLYHGIIGGQDLDDFWEVSRERLLPYNKQLRVTRTPGAIKYLQKEDPEAYKNALKTWQKQEERAIDLIRLGFGIEVKAIKIKE